jgi:hypothetical protein
VRSRLPAVAAGAAFGLWLALEALGLTLLARSHGTPGGDIADPPADVLRDLVIASVFAGVGLLLAIRRPRNAIGWLFLGTACCIAYILVVTRWAIDALITHPGGLPDGRIAAPLGLTAWIFLLAAIMVVLVLFPEGRLPSRRWRWYIVALGLSSALAAVGGLTDPGPLPKPLAAYDNGLGVDALGGVDPWLSAVAWTILIPPVVAAVYVVQRFRRARGVERKQYAWFCYAAAFLPAGLVGTQVGYLFGLSGGVWEFVLSSLPAVTAVLLPVATAIAILRYRLYEIDRVVSRTLVYGVLTVVLGAVYAGLVLVGQALFSSFAGGSNLAIAISTLVVAAAFMPARGRVQAFVDRRFYRRRYDAARTLERFTARLRDEVDLDVARSDLLAVVRETMEPAQASLWLRKQR